MTKIVAVLPRTLGVWEANVTNKALQSCVDKQVETFIKNDAPPTNGLVSMGYGKYRNHIKYIPLKDLENSKLLQLNIKFNAHGGDRRGNA